VGWRNFQQCQVRLCWARITIERSAADRFVGFGPAGALKNHGPVMAAMTRASAADLIRLPTAAGVEPKRPLKSPL